MRGLAAVLVLTATALLGAPAADARTTKLRIHTSAPEGFIFPGDGVFVDAENFLPRALCGKKPKFWIKDGDGKRWNLGRRRPKFKYYPGGEVYKFLRDLSRDAAPGRGWFKSRQHCKHIAKASGRQRITIVDPAARPEITKVRARDGMTGETIPMRFTVTDQSRVEAWIEYELVPNRWEKVDSLTRKAFFRRAGSFTLRWKASVGGDRVPPGHYRFVIQTRALDLFSEARGPMVIDDFFVGQEVGAGMLEDPRDAEVAPDGRIVVADKATDSLRLLNLAGALVGTVAAGFNDPLDIAISPDNAWYVADSENHRIVRLAGGAATGDFGQDQFPARAGPQGIAYGPQGGGRLYVVDDERDVKLFSLDGTSLGTVSTGDGRARTIDVAGDGSLWMTEPGGRVRHVGADGSALGLFPIERPLAVSVDPRGRILVADGGWSFGAGSETTRAVRVLDSAGNVVASVGQGIVGGSPNGLAVLGDAGDFVVVDGDCDCLQRFRLP
jgi:hypothetical protein